MHWASPLAGQVQGHQRERKPRVSIPDGFIAPAGPRREKGEQGRPHRYGPGCGMSSCVMLVGGGGRRPDNHPWHPPTPMAEPDRHTEGFTD